MWARRALALGQKGAKKFLKRYGEQLVSGPLSLRRTAAQTLQYRRNHRRRIRLVPTLRSQPSLDYELISRKLNCSVVSNSRATDGIPHNESGNSL